MKRGESENVESNYARTRARKDKINEAEFGLGYFFKSLEDHINAYTNQEGYPYSFAVVAHRLGRLLEASALRAEPRLAQLVPEMFENSAPALISAAGLDAIKEAQRERWRKYAQAARDRKVGRVTGSTAYEEQRAQALARKRTLTPKQLAAMQRNAVKARAARKKKGAWTLSAETRARISAARKAYWDRKRAEAQQG